MWEDTDTNGAAFGLPYPVDNTTTPTDLSSGASGWQDVLNHGLDLAAGVFKFREQANALPGTQTRFGQPQSRYALPNAPGGAQGAIIITPTLLLLIGGAVLLIMRKG